MSFLSPIHDNDFTGKHSDVNNIWHAPLQKYDLCVYRLQGHDLRKNKGYIPKSLKI